MDMPGPPDAEVRLETDKGILAILFGDITYADDGCHIMLHMDKAGDEKPFSMPFCTVLSLVRTDTGEELYRRRGISRKTARHKEAESAE